ncbi:polysaccharide biosynthesis protein [Exilibacterium tricleocarpae]|uniref:Polysaccharide biosynthesis protein n=1 Tax=Exilibacterium tricleocarpae TaxID=2591008 RepID=A0A545T3I9_9GAMM|nr:polysaccharide biosynthesis protein [Exilibacterium tricleocarpae]TQV71776.1 polysaccharide biosynthesis protein [Exilibacterium tricleocarpae]
MKDEKLGTVKLVGQPTSVPASNIDDMNQVVMWSSDELLERKIIYPGMRDREVLTAFREIRNRLLLKYPSNNLVVLVSCVGEHTEGNSTAVNLAASFALDERKTALYIDCSLGDSPQMDKLLPSGSEAGLTDFLVNEKLRVDDIIYATGLPRLRVVPIGFSKERASEYFNSKRMRQFIDDIKNRYEDRYTIIGAPSVSRSETRVLSQYCDASVLTVPFGKVVMSEVLAGVDALGKDRMAGLVFSK